MLRIQPGPAIDQRVAFLSEMTRLVLAAGSTRAPLVAAGPCRWPVPGVAGDFAEELEALVTTGNAFGALLVVDAGAAQQCNGFGGVARVRAKAGQPDQQRARVLDPSPPHW